VPCLALFALAEHACVLTEVHRMGRRVTGAGVLIAACALRAGVLTMVVLLAVACVAQAQAPPPAVAPPEVPSEQLLKQARPERLAKLYLYIHKKYPDLSQEAVKLIDRKYPQFWTIVKSRIDELAAGKYPQIQADIREQTLAILERERPELQRAVIDLINDRYPRLQLEIAEIIKQNPDQDPQPEIARLLRENYPTLLADIFDEVIVKHPRVLSQIVNAVAEKVPPLMADVMKHVQKKFPRLPRDIFQMAMKKHPELIEAANKILRGEPIEPEEPPKQPSPDAVAQEPSKAAASVSTLACS